MENGLFNALCSKAKNGKTIYHSWRELFQERKDEATMLVLQLFIDMTGFGYTVADTDLALLMEDDPHPLENNITTSSQDFFQNGTFVANFSRFWQHAIVHQWKELLSGNDWFNKCVMLVMLLCRSKTDECAMVGSFICADLVPHLCAAHHNLLNDMERAASWQGNQRKSSLKKKEYYIDQVCQALSTEIGNGFKYAKLSGLLMEKLCEAFVTYPDLLILTHGQLELLGAGLRWKQRQSVQLALKCMKQLMSDSFSSDINNAAGIFILKMENQLTRIMDSYKSSETAILHLFLEALNTVGNIPLCEETAEKIIHKMFNPDEAVVNAAIDLHGMYHAAIHPSAEVEMNALIAILDVYERYAYPLASFEAVIKKLWIKGFFRKLDELFQMLLDAMDTPANAGFIASCIAHTISYCHRLLMEDIRMKISPSSDNVNWSFMRKRMQSFVANYPKCLNAASRTPNIYNLLLNCMSPANNELYRFAEVDCEAYHEEVLFNILSKVALDECSYPVLFQTLTTIYSFDTIAHISEDVWNELTEKYYTLFFHTRSRLRSYNLGIDKKLMESYSNAITRLCVLIEINNTSEHVFTLAEYLANDLRLLPKMNLSDESIGIFYRLYKNALYAVVQCCLAALPSDNPTAGIKYDQLGKRVQAFMGVLVEQLDGGQQSPFTVSSHVANALCNMLILTQETADPSQQTGSIKQHMMYRVEPEVLAKLSAYIEQHVFGGGVESDAKSSCLLAQKLMLATYNDVYRLHLALPRQSDTCAIVKYYGENALFADELEQLLSIVYGKDPKEFFSLVAHVVMDYCKKTNINAKVKKFLSNLKQFAKKCLAHENEEEYLTNIIQSVIGQSLEQVFTINGVALNVIEKLFTIMKPLVAPLPLENRKAINLFIRQHPNFASYMEDENSELRTILKSFLKILKK
uniref:SCD domain-containing protein n=1 Tax=Anopheles coluzzii TaxID=1518534 RepID=A0A6E8VVS0_ANOCL